MADRIIYGRHPVAELLRAGRRRVRAVLYAQKSGKNLRDILALAEKAGVPLRVCDAGKLDALAKGALHQGIVAEVEPPAVSDIDTFVERVMKSGERPFVVALDSIVDPHNFGAILRSAESFGAAGAIFPKDRSADINSTVVKTSAGATEYMEFCKVTNMAMAMKKLRAEGFHVIAAEADGETSLRDFQPSFPLAVVLGSEGKGVRPLVRKNCDEIVRIPLSGEVASLNVSAAAAVVFYEISRQSG